MAKKVVKKSKKKKSKAVPARGRAYIQATYNNTIVTVTDEQGDVLSWSSAGKVGFKGPKKSTAYAASMIVKDSLDALVAAGLKEVDVFVKGVGTGREAAIRTFMYQAYQHNPEDKPRK